MKPVPWGCQWLCLALGLCLASACQCGGEAEKRAQADGLYFSAFEAIDSRNHAKARETAEALAKLAPQDKRLPTLRALLALSEMRFEEALPLLAEALQSQPERADLWQHAGALLQHKKQHAQAREAFEKALRLQPQNSEAHQGLAECLLALGEVEAALTHLRQAAEQALPMRQADVVFQAVEAMQAHGQAPQVPPWLSALAAHTQEPSFLLELLAQAHIAAGEFSLAVEALEAAVKTNPGALLYWEALSALYARQGALPRAKEALERGLRVADTTDTPSVASFHILLAGLCKRMQDELCAQAHAEQALAHVDSNSTEQLQKLAALWVELGKEAEAFHIYWHLSEEPLGRQNVGLQKQTARLAHQLGKHHEAAQACQRLRELEPHSACP